MSTIECGGRSWLFKTMAVSYKNITTKCRIHTEDGVLTVLMNRYMRNIENQVLAETFNEAYFRKKETN